MARTLAVDPDGAQERAAAARWAQKRSQNWSQNWSQHVTGAHRRAPASVHAPWRDRHGPTAGAARPAPARPHSAGTPVAVVPHG